MLTGYFSVPFSSFKTSFRSRVVY